MSEVLNTKCGVCNIKKNGEGIDGHPQQRFKETCLDQWKGRWGAGEAEALTVSERRGWVMCALATCLRRRRTW